MAYIIGDKVDFIPTEQVVRMGDLRAYLRTLGFELTSILGDSIRNCRIFEYDYPNGNDVY